LITRARVLSSLPADTATDPLVLVVGMAPEDLPHYRGNLAGARLEALPFTLIHAVLACVPWTDRVVSPLVADQFDAMDMARQLALTGYQGTYTVVVPPLPRPEIIRLEIQQICPGIHVELLQKAPH